jgi:hypothetical protein
MQPGLMHCRDVYLSIVGSNCNLNHSFTEISATFVYKLDTLTVEPQYVIEVLLTPWSRILLEKLTGLQLVKKYPVFYGTRRFITAFMNAHHLSLSWASAVQSKL